MATYDVDVVVLGLGPGGEYAAQKLAEAGLDVVGVERDLVGGECPFYGCIPSKMMIRAADALGEARRVDALAGKAEVTPDWGAVATRIDKQATNHWRDDSHVERLEDAGVRIVRGEGRLAGTGTVRVGEDDYVGARGVVLNVGTSPARLPIDGLAETPYWTNREIVKVAELPALAGRHRRRPDRLRAGPGVRAVRLAGDRARGGRPAAGPRGAGVERAASRRCSPSEGIRVETGIRIERVDHDGGFTITTDRGAIEADQLLLAAGRSLNLRGLGLDTVGLDPDARSVETDERMRAGERLWAVGDITGHGAFTHVSMYQGEIAARDVLDQDGLHRRLPRGDPGDLHRPRGRLGRDDRAAGARRRDRRPDRPRRPRGVQPRLDPPAGRHRADQAGGRRRPRRARRAPRRWAPTAARCSACSRSRCTPRCRSARVASMHYAYPTFHRAVEVAVASIL